MTRKFTKSLLHLHYGLDLRRSYKAYHFFQWQIHSQRQGAANMVKQATPSIVSGDNIFKSPYHLGLTILMHSFALFNSTTYPLTYG